MTASLTDLSPETLDKYCAEGVQYQAGQKKKGSSGKTLSESALRGQSRALTLFHEFRCSTPALVGTYTDREWDELPEEMLCSAPVYEDFADYISDVYVIPAGNEGAVDPLDFNTQAKYWSSALNAAAAKSKG